MDDKFATRFKAALLQPLASQSEQGDFLFIGEGGTNGVLVGFHGNIPFGGHFKKWVNLFLI
jgi:hypothetical protein